MRKENFLQQKWYELSSPVAKIYQCLSGTGQGLLQIALVLKQFVVKLGTLNLKQFSKFDNFILSVKNFRIKNESLSTKNFLALFNTNQGQKFLNRLMKVINHIAEEHFPNFACVKSSIKTRQLCQLIMPPQLSLLNFLN